jgi:uncharacterized cupredoxin-like copper-binding protein
LKEKERMYLRSIVLASSLAFATGAAWSHGARHDKKAAAKPVQVNAEEHVFGRAGNPKNVARTIKVGMHDNMHFTPGDIRIKQGDTVRFIATNDGKVMHEMVIGTMKELEEHAALMKKFPDMEHEEPYMAHVKPGGKETIVWQFTKPGEFYYACLIPGHFEAGMIAKITVERSK